MKNYNVTEIYLKDKKNRIKYIFKNSNAYLDEKIDLNFKLQFCLDIFINFTWFLNKYSFKKFYEEYSASIDNLDCDSFS